MCSVARIERFLDDWPRAEFGPAHVVLADANVDDSNLAWCAGLCRQWLGLEPRSSDPSEVKMWRDVGGWADHERVEIEATLAFLEDYALTPEAERIQPGDTLCSDAEATPNESPLARA